MKKQNCVGERIMRMEKYEWSGNCAGGRKIEKGCCGVEEG